ncbi:MAG: glutamate--cysteine ligase [Deltaproteobacteria bacterium]|nr:glutamate--cysteine ligase [Deltaproteobacteria bacterium]
MGLTIERDRFEDDEYDRFRERLGQSLRALASLLERPGFGEGPASLGAELEMALVGEDGRPRPVNLEVLRETLDPRMTVELNRFNLEANLRPTLLAGRPFSHLRAEMEGSVDELARAAKRHNARVAMIGILPTLRPEDLAPTALTDTARYRALSWALKRNRPEPFALHIDGEDSLEMQCEDVTFEGAATSLQIHLRVRPGDFSQVFNAAQLATAPALAVSANSPTFLGRRLWDETRVALFNQAVDVRSSELERIRNKPRVCFGSGWNRSGAYEVFEETVSDFVPLLPVLSDEDPEACVARGGVPQLGEIRLHHGTVWSWNRPVYDPVDGGHLRIELRALPAGPTVADMVANAAFLVGLTLGLAEEMSDWTTASFVDTHSSFYRAAQLGLGAEILWPTGTSARAGSRPVRDLLSELIPIARRGLEAAGVESDDIDPHLDLIEQRRRMGVNGAVWQRRVLALAERDADREVALAKMFERYVSLSNENRPIHEWPIDDA